MGGRCRKQMKEGGKQTRKCPIHRAMRVRIRTKWKRMMRGIVPFLAIFPLFEKHADRFLLSAQSHPRSVRFLDLGSASLPRSLLHVFLSFFLSRCFFHSMILSLVFIPFQCCPAHWLSDTVFAGIPSHSLLHAFPSFIQCLSVFSLLSLISV